MTDPTITDPDKYKVVFENERVRVLEYRDEPGAKTSPQDHPDSVMITLSGFDRRLTVGEEMREVTLEPAQIRWLDAQTHTGENIGSTSTHVVFVERRKTHQRGRPGRRSDPRTESDNRGAGSLQIRTESTPSPRGVSRPASRQEQPVKKPM